MMKPGIIVLSGALLFVLSSDAFAQRITSTEFQNGNAYSIDISDEDLVSTPAWNPEKQEVAPVSLSKAIIIARANLKRFVPETNEQWDIEKVILHRMGRHRWLYAVSFYCFLERCDRPSNGFTIYVKMDGKIVEPEVTKDEKSIRPD